MHNWNQLQPAPYDGMYQFPSITGAEPADRHSRARNELHHLHATNQLHRLRTDSNYGQPMLPAGKYVVEVVVPPGYELVKEEDKNILMGDSYIAPVTQEFGGLGNIFIIPDQAQLAAAITPTIRRIRRPILGATPRHEGDTGQRRVASGRASGRPASFPIS